MENKKYWVWLSRIEGLGSVKICKLLEQFKNPEIIWNLDKSELLKIGGIGEKIADSILDEEYRKNLERYLEYMEKYDIKVVTIQDEEYPLKLKNIYDAPQVLYVKGDTNILNDNSIAIVGCRDCTEYGKTVASKIAEDLAKENMSIISGMAKGIDYFAHIGCLKANGKTIAILGSRFRQNLSKRKYKFI